MPPSILNKSVTGVTNSVGGKQNVDNSSTDINLQVQGEVSKLQFGTNEPGDGHVLGACDCNSASSVGGTEFDKQLPNPTLSTIRKSPSRMYGVPSAVKKNAR